MLVYLEKTPMSFDVWYLQRVIIVFFGECCRFVVGKKVVSWYKGLHFLDLVEIISANRFGMS